MAQTSEDCILRGKHMSNRRSLRVLNESAPAHMVVTLSASEVKDLSRTKQGFFAFVGLWLRMTVVVFPHPVGRGPLPGSSLELAPVWEVLSMFCHELPRCRSMMGLRDPPRGDVDLPGSVAFATLPLTGAELEYVAVSGKPQGG